MCVVNPWRACAARVTVLGSCVCVSVCLLSHISPTECLFVLKTLSPTQRATKVKKFVAICLKLLRSRVMPRNMSEKANMLIFQLTRGQFSPLDTQRSVKRYPTIVNSIRPCPKRCLLMALARVGARTDSTTRYSYNARRGQFPRTRIGIVRKICCICAEGLHFSAFHYVLCMIVECIIYRGMHTAKILVICRRGLLINVVQGPGITSSSLHETKVVLSPELLIKDGK